MFARNMFPDKENYRSKKKERHERIHFLSGDRRPRGQLETILEQTEMQSSMFHSKQIVGRTPARVPDSEERKTLRREISPSEIF